MNQKRILIDLVKEKTKSLKDLNEQLENKIKDRTRQLSSSNKQLLNIIKSADLGYWSWNLQTKNFEVNDRWLSMIGISREDFHNSTKDWMKRIKREDLLKVFPIISTAIKKDQTFIVEFRMKHKNGQYVWIEGSGSTVDFDQEGRPLQVYGIHRDIQFKKEQ